MAIAKKFVTCILLINEPRVYIRQTSLYLAQPTAKHKSTPTHTVIKITNLSNYQILFLLPKKLKK